MQTNTLWHRRIPHFAIVVALLLLIVYILTNFFAISDLDPALHIDTLPALLAGITLLVAGMSYLHLPGKIQAVVPPVALILLLATLAATIHTTGGTDSHFIVLWVPAIVFVGLFGLPALLATALLPIAYSAWLYLTDSFTVPAGLTLALIGSLPLYVSHLLFSYITADQDDSSYTRLANQLSQVSGKSEVVINAISNGVIALDQQGIIELINPEAQRLIGWESQDALKLDYKSVLKLVDAESNEVTSANDPVRKALSTNEEVRTEELTLITNSGKKLLISLVASPVGQVGSGVIVVFRDITKEKAEEREQAEFISTASHEMRTPVASIEGYLGLALNPATAQIDDKARGYIMKAHEVAQHLGRLFQDLLDVTKAEDGRLSNNPRAIEVVSFMQDIVEGMRPQAEAKGLILVYKPIPDNVQDDKTNRRLNPVFYANVDNDHFREVVANLVENAIKYTKQGTISVDVSGDEKQVQVSIQDTGIGIPAEDLPHLFQKFYRVDNSDTREIGGTGLGLYLSRRLVEAMEGRIWAESQHGQGSTFFVSIPRISHQEAMQLIETLHDETPIQPVPSLAISQPDPIETPVSAQPPAPIAPSPSEQPASAQGDGVFASPSADAIAAQLANPQPQAPTQTASSQGPSLAAIEQNPGQYLRDAQQTPAQGRQIPAAPPRNYQDTPPARPESQNQP